LENVAYLQRELKSSNKKERVNNCRNVKLLYIKQILTYYNINVTNFMYFIL